MEDKLVSVIIPTFGRPLNLIRALESVLNQSYENIEIIVVDDNNPNTRCRIETEQLVTKFNSQINRKIIYIQHSHNKNGAAARNTGISYANGKYISFLDDDDEFLPDKINRQVKYLENNKDYNACYCKSIFFKNGKIIHKSSYNKIEDIRKDIFLLKADYNSSTLLFTKKSILNISGFDENFLRNQDYEVMIRYLRNFKLGVVDNYLLKRHADDITNQPVFEKYENIRIQFKNTFKKDILNFPEKTRKEIESEFFFDLAFYALKQKKMKPFFKYMFKSRPNITLLKANSHKIHRIINKINS